MSRSKSEDIDARIASCERNVARLRKEEYMARRKLLSVVDRCLATEHRLVSLREQQQRQQDSPESSTYEIDGQPSWLRQAELAEQCKLDSQEFLESLPRAW